MARRHNRYGQRPLVPVKGARELADLNGALMGQDWVEICAAAAAYVEAQPYARAEIRATGRQYGAYFARVSTPGRGTQTITHMDRAPRFGGVLCARFEGMGFRPERRARRMAFIRSMMRGATSPVSNRRMWP